MMLAHQRSFHGRHEEALRVAAKAVELDPVDPMVNFRLVQSFYFARRYSETVQSARTMIDLWSEFPNANTYPARVFLVLGKDHPMQMSAPLIPLSRS